MLWFCPMVQPVAPTLPLASGEVATGSPRREEKRVFRGAFGSVSVPPCLAGVLRPLLQCHHLPAERGSRVCPGGLLPGLQGTAASRATSLAGKGAGGCAVLPRAPPELHSRGEVCPWPVGEPEGPAQSSLSRAKRTQWFVCGEITLSIRCSHYTDSQHLGWNWLGR